MFEIKRGAECKAFINTLAGRGNEDTRAAQEAAQAIIEDVRQNGDDALIRYTEKFDHVKLDKTPNGPNGIEMTKQEIEACVNAVGGVPSYVKRAAERIRSFHERQRQNSWFETGEYGEILGQRVIPLSRAGVYVPGGRAAYPSTVLMNVIPASVAGVKEIIMTTPPPVNPMTVVCATVAGVDRIFKIGGAQAIAAMAFGTQSVPKTDKIVGPGNIYVAMAKRLVYGYVNIDSVAGPSEIVIVADKNANPAFCAADMLAQAEHDPMASAVLLTDDESLARAVYDEVWKQSALLSRHTIISQSLDKYGGILVTESLDDAFALANEMAPEHLELCVAEPFASLHKVVNAGAVFLGNYTPEAIGDYIAGPNHVLPTGRTAQFFSALSVDDFIKKSSLLSFSAEALSKLADDAEAFAKTEGLTGHGASVAIRKS